MTPAELVREARRRHGLTQRQLAARARTSQAAISRVERDLVSPSVSTLAGWLDLMGEELALAANPIDYGHDRTLNEVGAGDVVGELAVLAPAPRAASVTAVEPSLLLRLRRAPFEELLDEHPEVSRAVISTLARLLQAAADESAPRPEP